MSRLVLVRHAQASFLAENYDQLSKIGEIQARILGEYWVRHKVVFHRAACGPAVRHRESARLVAEVYRKAGQPFPEPGILAEFDEFQGDAVLAATLPGLRTTDPNIRRLEDAVSASNSAQKQMNFQRLFQAVVTRWVNGEIAAPDVESWDDFSVRVQRGLRSFLAQAGKGEHSVIFTSGGPIAIAVQRALHLSVQDALQIAWMSRNCSITEFLFTRDRFTLSSFNCFLHLDEAQHLTYR